MHEHLLHLLDRIGPWSYLAIFICVSLECAGVFFVPAESLVLTGGFFAARGQLNLAEFLAVVSAAAILGYSLGFDLGRRFGRPGFLHYGRWLGLNEKHFHKVDIFFVRYGGAAVFLGRFTWFMRAFVALVAGTSDLPYRRFLFFNILGGIFWAACFTLLGYFVGASWSIVEHWVGRTTLIAILILLVIGGLVWLRREK